MGEDRKTKRTNQRKEEKRAHWERKYGAKHKAQQAKREAKLIEMSQLQQNEDGGNNAGEDDDEDSIDDEEEGGEWIT